MEIRNTSWSGYIAAVLLAWSALFEQVGFRDVLNKEGTHSRMKFYFEHFIHVLPDTSLLMINIITGCASTMGVSRSDTNLNWGQCIIGSLTPKEALIRFWLKWHPDMSLDLFAQANEIMVTWHYVIFPGIDYYNIAQLQNYLKS